MTREYFYIQKWKKDEQKRDVNRSDEDDLVFSDDDGFTLHDDVPIVITEDDNDPHNGE